MPKPLRVLIVEDSEDDAALMLRELKQAGYDIVHLRVDTPIEMREALVNQTWDAVLSDYSMPKFSAPMALSLLQHSKLDIPFIIVSGTIGEDVAVSAMRTGANDYILKQNLTRLAAAVEREIRDAEVRKARRKAEESLKESELKYKNLVDSTQTGVCQTDLEGNILFVNDALVHMLEFTEPEDMKKCDVRRIYKNPDDREVLLKNLKKINKIDNYELELVTKTGKVKNVLINVTLQGEIISGMVRDITEHKESEEKIRMMEKLSMLGQFSATIAHEIRNPLAAISLNIELIASQVEIPEELKETIEDSRIGIQRIQKIITDILAFSRSKKLEVNPEDIHDILDIAFSTVKKDLEKNKIQHIKKYINNLFKISIDRDQIVQVFVNLFSNAIDVMPDGGSLTVQTSFTNHFLQVQIQDTGKGIPGENLNKIFNPFFTTKSKGTGLGLAIVYNILEQHKAKISVESEVGKGTTFLIQFQLSY